MTALTVCLACLLLVCIALLQKNHVRAGVKIAFLAFFIEAKGWKNNTKFNKKIRSAPKRTEAETRDCDS